MSGVACSLAAYLALGGSYRAAVVEDSPTAWFRCAEQSGGTVAKDSSGNGYHGAFAGGLTLGSDPLIPEGGRSWLFDGTDDRSTNSALPATTTTMTFEAWLKPTTPSGRATLLSDTTGTVRIELDASLKPNVVFGAADHLASSAVTDNALSHLMIVISAGSGTFYINGAAAGTFSSFPGFTPTRIGAYSSGTNPFKGYLDELVVYDTALSSSRVTVHYNAGFWTNVTADTEADEGTTAGWGIGGNGPKERLGDLGLWSLALNNSAGNSGGLQGYYSPGHANCRSGFTFGILAKLDFTYSGTTYTRFTGKVASIDPVPGRYGVQRTRLLIHDLMDDLIETDLRNVTIQTNQTEDQLLDTLLDAIPVTAQPLARSLDSGLDTSAFAFDKLEQGQKVIQPIGDLAMSSLGFASVGPTGIFRYENRQQRQLAAVSFTFADADLDELIVPTTLEGVYNRVRATFHPKQVDSGATTVLWAQTGDAPAVDPGATIEIWGDYYKASEPSVRIGGTNQVNPVATTDYTGNTVADGSGTDKTGLLTVTAEFFASTVKFTITNSDPATVYLTSLQCRGDGLYDLSPVTVESSSVQSYGDRPLNVDLPYQADYNITVALADYLRSQFESLGQQAHRVGFKANASAANMLAALTAQIGDRVNITEQVTGLVLAAGFVQSVRLDVSTGPWLHCTLGLASATYFDEVWVMDDAALSLADSTTIFGFA